jgi:hypothetical protein
MQVVAVVVVTQLRREAVAQVVAVQVLIIHLQQQRPQVRLIAVVVAVVVAQVAATVAQVDRELQFLNMQILVLSQ